MHAAGSQGASGELRARSLGTAWARDGLKESTPPWRTAAEVPAPQIMPLDLVAWALYRRGRSAEEVAEQTGLDLEETIEAIIRGFRLTLEEG